MKKINTILVCVLLFTLLMLISGCAGRLPAQANQTISYQLTQEPVTLDPQVVSDPSAVVVVEALFEGLVRLDESGNPYPGVAKSWTANADSTQFIFSLREDAVWSNGEPVTAHDFVFAFQRTLSPSTNSANASSMYGIKNALLVHNGSIPVEQLGVTAKDNHTLVIDLEYSYADFPALTATAPFMPCNQAFFEQAEGQYCLEASLVLGNGPFVMTNRYAWKHNESIQLSRSSSYVGDDLVYPSGLNFTIEPYSLKDGFSLLSNGVSDVASISADDLEAAEKSNCNIISFQDTTWGLCFQTSSEPMNQVWIRKAFLQTLDRAALLEHLPKNTVAANDIINPEARFLGQSYRTQAGSDFYLRQDDQALQTALSLLPSVNRETMPSVTVLCPDTLEAKRMVNEMITIWNRKMGNYFNMNPVPEEELVQKVASGEYEIALYPIHASGQDPFSLLSLFHSTSPSNPASLKDPSYDAFLTAAENGQNKNSLAQYIQAEKYLNEQGIFYPLYYQSHYYATAPGISGVVFHAYGQGIDFIRAGKDS